MRTSLVAALVLTLVATLTACAGDDAAPRASAPEATEGTTTSGAVAPVAPAVDLCAYSGLGTWVDVYDHVPAFAERGRVSPVGADDVDAMAAYGVHTLYLQVAKDDPRSPGVITDEAQAGEFLRRAHAAGIAVVAWYLPTHRDHELDVARTLALVEFESEGQRFDGVALDIEGTDAVTDIDERNRLLLDLVTRVDAAASTMPVGAIVYPPIAFDVLNPTLWPDFPWAELAPHVDVWLPMAYWTFRDDDSEYRDAYVYSRENVERLRDHIDDPDAPVHIIGGIGDETTDADLEGFRRAAAETDAIGFSVYDFDTLAPAAWTLLAEPPVACEPCCSADAG